MLHHYSEAVLNCRSLRTHSSSLKCDDEWFIIAKKNTPLLIHIATHCEEYVTPHAFFVALSDKSSSSCIFNRIPSHPRRLRGSMWGLKSTQNTRVSTNNLLISNVKTNINLYISCWVSCSVTHLTHIWSRCSDPHLTWQSFTIPHPFLFLDLSEPALYRKPN